MNSIKNKLPIGAISWVDLTVKDAGRIRDFYQSVVGWETEPVSMEEYEDYNMLEPGTSKPNAGICHARGGNAELPSQWLLYIIVSDLDKSISSCHELGGKVIAGPKKMAGYGKYCVIQDPAGAVAALFEQA